MNIQKLDNDTKWTIDHYNLWLSTLPSDKNYDQVETLELHSNSLTELSNSINKLSNLNRIYLAENNLLQLPESIGELSELEILSLNHNKLNQLPESIGQLSELRQLFLNDNKLNELPDSIGQLSNLSFLRISRNNLTKLPESIINLKKIYDNSGLEFSNSLSNYRKIINSASIILRKFIIKKSSENEEDSTYDNYREKINKQNTSIHIVFKENLTPTAENIKSTIKNNNLELFSTYNDTDIFYKNISDYILYP